MQLRSAAARQAVTAYAARPAIPVRCAPETEKAVFARLQGRPNDADSVAVLSTGIDKQFRDRWDLVRRGVILPAPDAVIVRNEVPQADIDAASKRQPAKTVKVFANPRADIIVDAKNACCLDFTTKKRVYFADAYCLGVAQFARVKVDFVTDDAAIANALSQVLSKAPKSYIPKFHQVDTTGVLLHSSTKDEQAGGLEGYVMYDSKIAVARGSIPSVSPILEAFASMAAARLVGCEVLVAKADIHRDAKSGAVTLTFGEASPITEGTELHGSKFAAWGSNGASRLFEGEASEKDLSSKVLSGARSKVEPVKRLVFVNTKGGKPKTIDAEAAKKLFVEKFAVFG